MVRCGRLVVKDTEEEKEEEEHVGNTDMSSFSHSHYLASLSSFKANEQAISANNNSSKRST